MSALLVVLLLVFVVLMAIYGQRPYLPRLSFPTAAGVRKVRVRTWNGRDVCGSEIEPDLERIGFMREDTEMIFYRRF